MGAGPLEGERLERKELLAQGAYKFGRYFTRYGRQLRVPHSFDQLNSSPTLEKKFFGFHFEGVASK